MRDAPGCTACGTERTVAVDAVNGRRCPDHLTGFPLPYQRSFAMDLVDVGRPDLAFSYLQVGLLHLMLPMAHAA